ncbi:2-hydroxy-palmitic acid dioxygenase mpo1 [Linum grandiflorum]
MDSKCSSLFDLERHFAFYGAYHSNPTNILFHMIFVWPILFASQLILYFTPTFIPNVELSLFGIDASLVFNVGFLLTLIYGAFYVCLDKKAGSLAAVLLVLCWLGSSFLGSWLGFSISWKFFGMLVSASLFELKSVLSWKVWSFAFYSFIHVQGICPHWCQLITETRHKLRFSGSQVVVVAQIVCWTGQFIGHGVFEKRAPALLDNLIQAFVMAPFFVLLEALQTLFGYEPYLGFQATVQAKVDAEILEWQEKKQKLLQ